MHISLRLVFSNTPKRLLLQFAPRIREAGSGDIFKSGLRTHSFSCSLWSLLTSTSWEKPDPLPVLLVAVSPVKEMIHCFSNDSHPTPCLINTIYLRALSVWACYKCVCVCVCNLTCNIVYFLLHVILCFSVFTDLWTCKEALWGRCALWMNWSWNNRVEQTSSQWCVCMPTSVNSMC